MEASKRSTIRTLGPVGLNPTGEYDETHEYERLDVVYYEGSSYVALQESIGQLPTNTEYWNCIAVGYLKQNTYDSVADMKADNTLRNGMHAQTVGYYSANDGGGATYKIRNITNQDVIDEGSIISLDNQNLIAELIIDNSINIKQFGAKGDGVTDDTQVIKNIINKIINNYNTNEYSINTLYFPTGNYKITEKITIPNFITLKTNGNVTFTSYVSNDITLLFNNVNISGNNNYHYIGEKFSGNFNLVLSSDVADNTGCIGIQLQSSNSQSGLQNFNAWNIFKNIQIKNFDIGIKFIMKNLFLMSFENIILSRCNIGIYFDNSITNSGERISFNNLTIGNCKIGIESNKDALELNIFNSSIDFTDKCIIVKGSGNVTKLTNCHIEGIGFDNSVSNPTDEENPFLYYTNRTFFGYNMLMIVNCDIMTIRNIPIQSGLNGVNVFLSNVTTKGSEGFNNVFELCDDNCNIIDNKFLPSIYFQMITQKKLNQKINANFENTSVQNLTDNQVLDGYTLKTGFTGKASITDAKSHVTNGKSLLYNVPSGGSWFQIESEEFDVIPNNQLCNSFFYYFESESSKGIRCKMQTTFYDKDDNVITYPTNVSDEGTNYTVSSSNEWNRPFNFEQVTIPTNAVKGKTTYTFNPVAQGSLYITDFYRLIY